MEESDFNIVVAGTADSVLMVEGAANGIPENELLEAIEYGHIEANNPVTRRVWMKRDKTSEDAREWLRPSEEDRLWTTLATWKDREPRFYFAIATMLLTGMRFGELRALQWKHALWDTGNYR